MIRSVSRIAAVSDRILEAIRALKAIEVRKRQLPPSTPEYHALTEASAEKSREIFAAAAEQDRLARSLKPRRPDDRGDLGVRGAAGSLTAHLAG